jgi:hypothetical protein
MSLDIINGLLDDVQESVSELKENRFEFLKSEISKEIPEGINYLIGVRGAKTRAGDESLVYTFAYPKPIKDDGQQRYYIKDQYIAIPTKQVGEKTDIEKKRHIARVLGLVKWTNELIGESRNASVKTSLSLIQKILETKAIEVDIVHTSYTTSDGKTGQNVGYKPTQKTVDFPYISEYQEFVKAMAERNANKSEADKLLTQKTPIRSTNRPVDDDIPF